jgi:hypothetical protein
VVQPYRIMVIKGGVLRLLGFALKHPQLLTQQQNLNVFLLIRQLP